MTAQRLMTKKYRDAILQDVKDSINLECYKQDTFPINYSNTGYSRDVEAPKGLLEIMDAKDDLKSGIAIFEAYKKIPLIVAGNPVFWETLAHDELFPYVKKRWPLDGAADLKTHILNHWFVTRGMIRHALGGLWWAVNCSYDKNATDPFELTRYLFANYSFRTAFYGASTFIRSKEATLGILTFLRDNPDLQGSMEITGRFIANYFNKLGATKQLVYLGRNFFINELNRLKPEIQNLKNREEISRSIMSMGE